MKKWIFLFSTLFALHACHSPVETVTSITDDYIKYWKTFYPSRALANGDREAAFQFEQLIPDKIRLWILLNERTQKMLSNLPEGISNDDRIDADLLTQQVKWELESWKIDRLHEQSPQFYTGLMSQAMTHILARGELNSREKAAAIKKRLSAIQQLCQQGQILLTNGRPFITERSLSLLDSLGPFYEKQLPAMAQEWLNGQDLVDFGSECRQTAAAISLFASHIAKKVKPELTLSDSLGSEDYARKLSIFTGLDLTPDKLKDLAYTEIVTVRKRMAEVAENYWLDRYGKEDMPGSSGGLIARAIDDMEKNREKDQQSFLQQFKDLIDLSEDFIQEKNIASLPARRTLTTLLSPPHFAGAAVGGVYASGPFNPQGQTILYLPTITDDADEETKEGFYRSFNNHFNAMIITHEIIPGHYMQAKIAATNPRLVRSLFSDTLYSEGWATLIEVVTLDAGWNNFNKLDRLAHLRKRLENATRAYVSVMVHCNDWDRDRTGLFAVEEGLLAPQFALNLWHRVMASPFQLVSYFLGFKHFSELLSRQKQALGDRFNITNFCDTILRAGAIPIRYLPALFQESE